MALLKGEFDLGTDVDTVRRGESAGPSGPADLSAADGRFCRSVALSRGAGRSAVHAQVESVRLSSTSRLKARR